MKTNNILGSKGSRGLRCLSGLLGAMALLMTACTLDYEPISTPTELTEGSQTEESTAVLKDKQAAEDQLTNLYELFRSRVEHWYVDKLLLAESHSDNAYAGTTGAEVEPYESNAIDASNSVLSRDWTRFLEDIAQSNVLINGLDQLLDNGQVTQTEYNQLKAQGCIFRHHHLHRQDHHRRKCRRGLSHLLPTQEHSRGVICTNHRRPRVRCPVCS